jgi:hypothetical protein
MPDAEFLREKTKAGQKNIDFSDLMDSIKYDIADQTRAGQYSTTYKLKGENIEFADAVLHHFREGESTCDITYDEEETTLHISWEAQE